MKVVMPKMGMNMEEGTIVGWKKKDGDYVKKGEILLEIMSNKVNMDIEAVGSGHLRILKQTDDVVPVGEVIALIEGELAPAPAPVAREVPVSLPREAGPREVPVKPEIEVEMQLRERIPASPRARMLAEEKKIPLEEIKGTGPGGIILERDVLEKIGEKVPPTEAERRAPVFEVPGPSVPEPAPVPVSLRESESYSGAASPLAGRVASEKRVDLSKVKGTGIGGKITKEDVLAYLEQKTGEREERLPPYPISAQPIPELPQPEPEPISVTEREPTPVPLPAFPAPPDESTLPGEPTPRKAPLPRPPGELSTTPFPATEEPISPPQEGIELKGIRRLIAERMLKSKREAPHLTLGMEVDMTEASKLKDSLGVSYTDIMVRAVASALKRHPMLNSTLKEDRIILHDTINIGIAVSRGEDLIVPVIQKADTLSLQELSKKTRDLIERTKNDQLTENDVINGTFTVTNLGMFDIDFFTPIINPPEAAILGMGKIEKKPVVVNDRVEIRFRVTLSLSFDHRIVNGMPASLFLKEIRTLLENPYRLLVEG